MNENRLEKLEGEVHELNAECKVNSALIRDVKNNELAHIWDAIQDLQTTTKWILGSVIIGVIVTVGTVILVKCLT